MLIVLDDAAYSDLGAYGGEIDTTNIDRLANNGVLFTQFHVTPNCSSTRASLLTGMDHRRTGLGTHGVTADNQREKPGYEGYLNRSTILCFRILHRPSQPTSRATKVDRQTLATWNLLYNLLSSMPTGKQRWNKRSRSNPIREHVSGVTE